MSTFATPKPPRKPFFINPSLFLVNKNKANSAFLELNLPVSLLSSQDELVALLQEPFNAESWGEHVSHYEFTAKTGTNLFIVEEELRAVKLAMCTPKWNNKRSAAFDTEVTQYNLSAKKIRPLPKIQRLIEDHTALLLDLSK